MIFFFQKNPSVKKNVFSFCGGEGKEELASVSEFVLQRIRIKKKKKSFIYLFIYFFFGGGGGGGG